MRFPHVCPEPVLVKRSFLVYKNGRKKGTVSSSTPIGRWVDDLEQLPNRRLVLLVQRRVALQAVVERRLRAVEERVGVAHAVHHPFVNSDGDSGSSSDSDSSSDSSDSSDSERQQLIVVRSSLDYKNVSTR